MSESNDHRANKEPFTDDGSGTRSISIAAVESEQVLQTVFDLRPVDLRVYEELLRHGESTSDDIAESISRHRSYVNRALTSLRRCGLVQRHRRLLSDGGFRYVYEPRSREEVRKELQIGIEQWANEAKSQIEKII